MEKTFPQLLVLYETGQLAGAELDRFFQLLELEENQALLAAAIDEKARDESRLLPENELNSERAVASLKQDIQVLQKEEQLIVIPAHTIRMRRRNWAWAAASVLLLTAAGWYLVATNKKAATEPAVATQQPEIQAPQNNRAMITLADGRKIYLDSAGNGLVTSQGSARLTKTADGQISYSMQGAATSEPMYNTLYNPRGSRVINLELADGTRVWLNSGSSLSYPVGFTGNERKVSITGEAYFEVAHDAQRPFYVSHKRIAVKVLGTHFNVNTYEDEPDARVTLLAGKVEVRSGAGNREPATGNKQSAILKPGEQAITPNSPITNDAVRPGRPGGHSPHLRNAADGQVLTIDDSPNIEQVMAWKNGRFVFGDKVDVATIIRQVARWYDLEVELQGNFSQHFGGSISREANASEVFKVLEATGGLRCKVTGRKVLVTQE